MTKILEPGYRYKAKVLKVKDGDTCTVLIDFGFKTYKETNLRFYGLDTPESRTRNLEEKEMGLTVKRFTKERLEGKEVIIDTTKAGKYAERYLGRIYLNGSCINDEILGHKMAWEYWGGPR